jgi:hypothetical protein
MFPELSDYFSPAGGGGREGDLPRSWEPGYAYAAAAVSSSSLRRCLIAGVTIATK